jgi:hypothetical protein
MAKVFICYRREDSIETAGRIYSWLSMRLSQDDLFFDVQTIQGGTNFRQAIAGALADEVKVMLVIIGRSWLLVLDEHGEPRRRLNEPDDHVRQEIELAFEHDVAIIPLLVQGARMPQKSDLPPSIAALSDINALPVRPEPDFDNDMRRVRVAILDTSHESVAFHQVQAPPSVGPGPRPDGPQPPYIGPPRPTGVSRLLERLRRRN